MAIPKAENSISCLIVTYGDRWQYLKQVIFRLEEVLLVDEIFVVDNGATYDVEDALSFCGSGKSRVLRLGENKGSAGGFSAGIDWIIRDATSSSVLILDDDNVPRRGTIERLHDINSGGGQRSLLCVRPDRKELVEAARTGQAIKHIKNSFMGFDLTTKLLRRVRREPKPFTSLIPVDYAPYGGLLVPMTILKQIGLPLAEFFLYVDDHEFTTRLARQNSGIFLVADCFVDDVEQSWIVNTAQMPPIFATKTPEFRIYYNTRNRIWFERQNLVRNNFAYVLNAFLLISMLSVRAAIRGAGIRVILSRLRLLTLAAAAGWRGKLGKWEQMQP